MSISRNYLEILNEFDSIGLNDIAGAALMDRMDEKYVFHIDKLAQVLSEVKDRFNVLEIVGKKKQSYKTIYFDTASLDMYLAHHNGLRYRQKIRQRTYLSSNQQYIEIKHKNNKGKTFKKREKLKTDYPDNEFLENNSDFNMDCLIPTLNNGFERITLVHKEKAERITIDTNLQFSAIGKVNNWTNQYLCIIEIKTERSSGRSEAKEILKKNRIYKLGFSKYCFGMVLLNPNIKKNIFLPRIHRLKKLNIIE